MMKVEIAQPIAALDFHNRIRQELDELKRNSRLRELRDLPDTPGMLNLSSNDYLGLADRLDLQQEFFSTLNAEINRHCVMSASSSRLLTGNHSGYRRLEQVLADLYDGFPALALNSGYHANIGILPALAGRGDLILSDKLNHASIVDGMQLAAAEFKRYPHLDYDALEKLLRTHRGRHRAVFIVTETVFSMDGDIADLNKLVELKKRYNATLIVDEAHAVGVFGATGCGVCEEQGVMREMDIIIGTFGKALCSCGAYVISSETIRDYLINRMRPLIFTTALPPVVIDWNTFVIEKVAGMNTERMRLKRLADKFRQSLKEKKLSTSGNSQIVPLMLGNDASAVNIASYLRDAGILVFPIRPPTVPAGTARLRFSLRASLSEADIDRMLAALETECPKHETQHCRA